MSTHNQTCNKIKLNKFVRSKTPALNRCPQKKGVCVKLVIKAPKKPNSALRKLVKLKISSNKAIIYAYIPGEGHNLQVYSTVLVRGGRVKDLPGIKYTLIRGKFDFKGVGFRVSSRSKYGVKKNIRKYL